MRRLLPPWWIVFLLSLPAVLLLRSFGWGAELKIERSFFDQEALRTSLDSFMVRNRRFPSAAEGLRALVSDSAKGIPRDPWGNDYVYRIDDEGHYVLYSVGANARDEIGAGDDVTTPEKEYECSTYGVDCGPSALTIGGFIALTLLLVSGAVGLVEVFFYLRKTFWPSIAVLRPNKSPERTREG
jgi:hypothetical protein